MTEDKTKEAGKPDDSLAEDLPEEEQQATDLPIDSPLVEEKAEEASEFFRQWKERHQAYLASQATLEKTAEETESKTDVSEDLPSKPSRLFSFPFFKKKKDSAAQTETVEKADVVKKKSKPPIPASAIWKSMPIILFSLSFVIVAIYFISPLSRKKTIEVVGNSQLTAERIVSYSLIAAEDYAVTTWLHKDSYAKNIEKNSNFIKSATISYTFPNRFTIQVEEYKEVGYLQENNAYYTVLSSGNIAEIATTVEELPTPFTTIHLVDKGLVKELALQLAGIEDGLLRNIQTIQLTPSKVTADLLTLTMYDGNQVLVPLSEIGKKLPYYSKIAPHLSVASTIDMEVGIFSYGNEGVTEVLE